MKPAVKNNFLTFKWVLLAFGLVGLYTALIHHGVWTKPEKWVFLVLFAFWLVAFFAPRLPLPLFSLLEKLWDMICLVLSRTVYFLLFFLLLLPWSVFLRLLRQPVFRAGAKQWREIGEEAHFLKLQSPEKRLTFVAEVLMFLICDRLYWFWSFLLLCLFFGGGFFLTSSDPGAAPFIYTLF
jgi:hypothetical protein